MDKIKFIRRYVMYRTDVFDIVYKSGRVVSKTLEDLPKTAQAFLDSATHIEHQWDSVYNRGETIYRLAH